MVLHVYYFAIAMVKSSFNNFEFVFGKGKPMFIIRTAFWLSLLILLLPTNEQDQRVVYGNAQAAIKDLSSFCSRNPDVCESSKKAARTFSAKAEFGAKMVMDFFQKKTGASAYINASVRRPAFLRKDSHNTLPPGAVWPSWSVPSNGPGV